MDRIGGIENTSRNPGERPTPARAVPLVPPPPVETRVPAGPRRRSLALTVALRRLDRIQSLLLATAARPAVTGVIPFPKDVRRLTRDFRVLVRAIRRSRRPDVAEPTRQLLEHLGLKTQGELNSAHGSVWSLPRFAQVEPLLRRLGTIRGRGELADPLSIGFRGLRRTLTDVLAELPPVLDVEA